ncbi:MAG: MFS transporter [Halodesulfurarchaeum sp.]
MRSHRGERLAVLKDPEFLALSGTAFARAQSYSTILIALALYADMFGTTGTTEGLFGTAFAIVQLFIVLPLGRAVDTGNAKRYLLLGLLLNVGVFLGFIFVQSPVHVILMRIVQGVGASLLWITGTTVVGQIAEDGARGRWLGMYNQVGAFSSFAGDLVGGFLLYRYGFTEAYLVLSAITLFASGLVFVSLRTNPGGRTDPDEHPGIETLRELLRRPMIRALVIFRLGFSVGKMSVIIFLPIFARKTFGVSPLAIGGILAGGKLTKAALQGWMGDLTDRLGNERHFVLVGALIYAVGTAMIPVALVARNAIEPIVLEVIWRTATITGPMLVMFGAYAIIGVSESIRLPASMSLFIQEGERLDSAASSMSLRSISWKVGQVAGPLGIGIVKEYVSITAAFLGAAAFVLAASIAFVLSYTWNPDVEQPPPEAGPTPGSDEILE